MTGEVVAGVDCSTQQTKVVIVEIDSGAVVGFGSAPHEVTGEDGARETDPVVWHQALATALASTDRAHEVAAISIAGQQHGLVVADVDNEPLRPAILWNDTRCAAQAERLTERLGGAAWWASRIGVVPVPSITVAKWSWLRECEPEIARQTQQVKLPHEWLTSQLTGGSTTDRGDASGTGWWSVIRGEYDEQVLDEVSLDPSVLPTVLTQAEAGYATPAAAEEFGLRAGTPVAIGTGDNMAAALGLGIDEGTPVLSLGTSGTAYTVSTSPASDSSGVVAGFADATSRYLPLACTLNCTLAVDRMARWLGLEREQVSPNTDVIALPYLDGERTPNLPHATGMIVGLRHTTAPQQILRAMYEGAVASLIDALEAIDEHSSGLRNDASLVLIGGGARGQAWRDVVRRLSGKPLQVPADGEFVALGAAAQAAALVTDEAPLDVARGWGHGIGEEIEPLERDDEALHRISSVRADADELLNRSDGCS